MSLAMLIFAAMAQVGGTDYDCTMDRIPSGIVEESGQLVVRRNILVPRDGDWRAQITISNSDGTGLRAELRWPESPTQLDGRYPVVRTTDNSVAFVASSDGSCPFGDACLALVQIVDSSTQHAQILITPSATRITPGTTVPRPYPIIWPGTCTRSETHS